MLLKISLFVLGIIACNGQDPCLDGEHRVLEDDYRNVDQTCLADLTSGKCDTGLVEGWNWYAFKLQGQYADIPTNVCIMPGACGTWLPMRLLLNGSLPEKRGDEVEAVGCTAFNILDKWDCCVLRSKVIVRSCGDFRLYRLQPSDRCPVSYCAQLRVQVPSSSQGKTKMIQHSDDVDQESCPAEDLASIPTRFPEDSTTANTTITTATAVSDTETPAAASTTEGLAITTTMAASSDVTSTSSTLAESSTVAPGPDVTTDLGPGTSTTPDSADTSSSPSPPGESSTDASSSVSSVTDDMGLGTSTTASDSEADSTSVSAPGTTSVPSVDTTSVAGVDTTSFAGVDTTSAPGVDATSALGADSTSALGADTTSALGADTTSAIGVDTTSALGVDITSASGVDTTSASVTVASSDSATSTVSESDTVTTAPSGMSTDSDAASTDLSGSDATTASPGDVTSEVVRTLFTTSVSDVTSVANTTSAGDVTTGGDLQDATATPSATTGTETAASGTETSSPAPASVSPSAGVSRSDDTSDQTASPTSLSDVTSSGEPMQGDTTSHSTSTPSTDVITDVDMTTAAATTSPATSTSTSAATSAPSVTPTDTTPTPRSTPSSTPTATPAATPTSTMTPRGMEPITAAPKPRETRLQLVFDVQDKTVTIANFQEELQAAFNRMLNQPELEPEGWGRFKDYPDSRAANSTLNPEGVIFVSVIVRNQSVPVLAEQLKRFLDKGAAREFLEKDMMLSLVAYCVMGDPCSYYRRPQSARPSVFDRNLTLFVFLIVLAILIVLVLVFGLIYYRYCYRSGKWVNKDVESKETVANGKNKGKAAGSVESPLSDAEIMRDEVAVEKETPLTSNGAMGADVDNSVVPYPDTEDINAQAMADPAKMEDTKL